MRSISAQSPLLLASLLLALAPSLALARAAGHSGATDSPGSGTCNRCHSPQTYDGLSVLFEDKYRLVCYAEDENGWPTNPQTIYAVPYGATLGMGLVAAEPPRVEPGSEETGVFCPEGDTCPDTPVAGFDIEVSPAYTLPNGEFPLTPNPQDPGTRQAGGEGNAPKVPNEVVHSEPRAFSSGKVQWNLVLRTPPYRAGANNPQSLTFYAAVNACNGNGVADPGDITAYTQQVVYFLEPGATSPAEGHTGPECITDPRCEERGAVLDPATAECVCEGGAKFDEQGLCPTGCSCRTSGSAEGAFAWLAAACALGLLLPRRRRR